MKIKWISENEDNDPTVRGYWRSADGRFSISPNYRHTIYPDSYSVRDNATGHKTSYDRVRDCKEWATKRMSVPLEALRGDTHSRHF